MRGEGTPLLTDDAAAFRRAAAAGARLLGLDVGEKTIGCALSDALWTVASPLVILKRGKFAVAAAELAALAREHGVGGLVIGLPRNMDGSEGPRCQATRQFAVNLAPRLALPTLFWDERLSTVAVERAMLEADLSRQKRKTHVDKLAAAYMLQGCVDALRRKEDGH